MVPAIDELLERFRPQLVRFLTRHGRGLLRYETAEDLAQGVCLGVLEGSGRLEYRGEREFLGWLLSAARRHVADRHEYWTALKRDAGYVLRVTVGQRGSVVRSGVNPASPEGGPRTFAERRETYRTAMRAVATLSERDRELVQWLGQGVSLDEVAERLGSSYKAAQKARHRALERWRQAYAVIARGRSG